MVTEGLNKIAVGLGKQVRDALENEVVELDVAVAMRQSDYDVLMAQARQANDETNKLWQDRKVKLDWLTDLDRDIRELTRPREGFPYLDDVAYETRMHELRVKIQEASEELAKRATWSE